MNTKSIATARENTFQFDVSEASAAERETIYRLRHEIYARELRQHRPSPGSVLRDSLDERNVYLVARIGEEIAGFISITPPGGSYSMDKYILREKLPFEFDEELFEIRLLTVLPERRGSEIASLLMYAALRWVEAHGGTRIMAIGRREVLGMYLRSGLKPLDISVQAGAVSYQALQTSTAELRQHLKTFSGLLDRLESKTHWRLDFTFRKPAACFHGGAIFEAIGPRFDTLERHRQIINADVLDAWFDPSPRVTAALREELPWLLRTSPPAACEGLVAQIAESRGVRPMNLVPGAGSSDLIFRALRHWLTPNSHVLILDPTYGEYAHVLERVIGCTVDRLGTEREQNYRVNLDKLKAALADHYDLVVLVNPNSPIGAHINRDTLQGILRSAPRTTRFWIDETYIEYAGAGESLERFAATSANVVVCKSMSKVYALSGCRVAYLCGSPVQLEAIRAITPPWVTSLPAQVAAVKALQDPDYYKQRYAETAIYREQLARELNRFSWDIVPGMANFLLGHLPEDGPEAAELATLCRSKGLFLRDASTMGALLGKRAIRIAVKDGETNRRAARIIREALSERR